MDIFKIGEGAYGKVYFFNNKIVKFNLIDNNINGLGLSIKELDILSKLKGYPYIIDLIDISFSLPFDEKYLEKLNNKEKKNYNIDSLFLIFEYAELTLSSFKKKKEYTIEIGKKLICQILLAIEYMHSKNITHRDLKPTNIMVKTVDDDYQIKIIDFGMSQFLTDCIPSTPGVTTSIYRAPEICCTLETYNNKCDIWSIGCIIYELFGYEAFLYGTADDNSILFNKIINKIPILPNIDSINKMIKNNKKIIPKNTLIIDNRPTFCQLMKIKNNDTINNLLNNMFQLDHENRYSATDALNDIYFTENFQFIEECRNVYLSNKITIPIIKIINCIEHKWIIDIAIGIFKNQKKIFWYTHKILFHSIDLFDRYLEHEYIPTNFTSNIETDMLGKLHSIYDVILIFYTCLYLFYKYYSCMEYCQDFKTFMNININYNIEFIKKFELKLLCKVCKYELYRLTLLEIMPYYTTKYNIDDLFTKYCSIISWDNGSVRALYRHIYLIQNTSSTPT